VAFASIRLYRRAKSLILRDVLAENRNRTSIQAPAGTRTRKGMTMAEPIFDNDRRDVYRFSFACIVYAVIERELKLERLFDDEYLQDWALHWKECQTNIEQLAQPPLQIRYEAMIEDPANELSRLHTVVMNASIRVSHRPYSTIPGVLLPPYTPHVRSNVSVGLVPIGTNNWSATNAGRYSTIFRTGLVRLRRTRPVRIRPRNVARG